MRVRVKKATPGGMPARRPVVRSVPIRPYGKTDPGLQRFAGYSAGC